MVKPILLRIVFLRSGFVDFRITPFLERMMRVMSARGKYLRMVVRRNLLL